MKSQQVVKQQAEVVQMFSAWTDKSVLLLCLSCSPIILILIMLCQPVRTSGGHFTGETPGGWRDWLGGSGRQRPAGGAGAVGKTQECDTQDLLQVRQDHNWVLSGSRRDDQRVWPHELPALPDLLLFVPVEDMKRSLALCRYIFLEYAAPTQAVEAVKNADGYKLDKQHTFRVNLFTDFDKYVTSVNRVASRDLSLQH